MEEEINYEVLTPNNMIENKSEDALQFAFENEKINNIAITGQYSSGKSSMIRTYLDKKVKKKNYLNISLATFYKSNNDESKESNSLEKIIIEKLYYSVLKKYNIQKDVKESILTMIFVIFVNTGIYLFNIEAINKSLMNNFKVTTLFVFLEIIFLTIVISYFISYLMNLQEIKLKLGDVEVEVNQDSSEKSNINLLNEELDFIVKIMNIAKYKYIIFEDLDRFENHKIFERLRDLNITLNLTLKYKVKFIYAIRDELIESDNRTKFFDFIIPVVPYVSYETSGEELLKIVKKYGLENELSEDFILDVSLYVSDIRILKNTVNEYLIYKKTLDKKIPDYEKLFSILLFKNTCSEDFAKLQNKDGEVYKCFVNKNIKINECIEKEKEKIKLKKEEYDELEKKVITKNSLKELIVYMIKSSYKNSYDITMKNDNYGDVIIKYGMNTDSIEDMIFDGNTTVEYYNSGWKEEKLSDYLKNKCPSFFNEYEEYKNGIENIKDNISSEIKNINKKIDKIKEYTLSELIQDFDEVVQLNLEEYNDLVKYLLSNGYIDENYNTYINKFHEGSITERDYTFIINVKNSKNNDYKAKLDNIVKIIKRLKNIEFKKEESLNIYILDVLLKDQDNTEKTNIYLNTLINSNNYIEVITYCICESNEFINKKELIINLCDFDKNILKNIKESKVEKYYKDLILEFIIVTLEQNKLKELKDIDEIISYVQKNNLLKTKELEDIQSKLREFDIKFYNISEFKNNTKLYEYIIENNMYIINYENILDILINEDESNKNLIEESNYNCISDNEKLKEYVNNNIQDYIDNVYSKLRNKQNNPVSIIKLLINNPNIELESKQTIISKETNKIDNIVEIKDSSLWKNIFDNDLINLEWDNINNYYNKLNLDETLIKIFNDEEKRKSILQEDIMIEEQSNSNFVKDLMLSNELNENTYNIILKKSKYKLNNTTLTELNEDRLIKLITTKRIECNIEMLENVRDYSTEILIVFIKNNYSYIHREIDNGNIIFTLDEINEIIKSDVTSTIKSKCLDMIKDEELDDMSLELIENIAIVSVENNFENKMSEKMLLEIISNIDNVELNVNLLNLNFKTINRDNINNYLDILGGNYPKILVDRTRPKLRASEINKTLLENIKKLGYNIKFTFENNNIVLSNTIR